MPGMNPFFPNFGLTSFPWVSIALLAIESNQVIALRCAKLARGGAAAGPEFTRMITEKMFESAAAAQTLMTGGSHETVIAAYRKRVKANARRLNRAR
jgi:hypothetical protein